MSDFNYSSLLVLRNEDPVFLTNLKMRVASKQVDVRWALMSESKLKRSTAESDESFAEKLLVLDIAKVGSSLLTTSTRWLRRGTKNWAQKPRTRVSGRVVDD